MPIVVPQSSSLIPLATDALIALLTAGVNIEVRDGAPLQDEERAGLYVGADLDNSDFPGWQQQWSGLGHAVREEVFEIPCLLFVRVGDNAIKPVRDECFAYLALVEGIVRSSPTLGITTNTIRAQVLPVQYSQPQTPDGVLCRIRFNVQVEGRI